MQNNCANAIVSIIIVACVRYSHFDQIDGFGWRTRTSVLLNGSASLFGTRSTDHLVRKHHSYFDNNKRAACTKCLTTTKTTTMTTTTTINRFYVQNYTMILNRLASKFSPSCNQTGGWTQFRWLSPFFHSFVHTWLKNRLNVTQDSKTRLATKGRHLITRITTEFFEKSKFCRILVSLER